MNRRGFLYSLLGLTAVVALPSNKAEAAEPLLDPAPGTRDEASADLPAAQASDAQYYYAGSRRRVVRRRRVVVYRQPVRRRVYARPVVVRRRVVRRRVYTRPVVYRTRRW